MNVHDLLQEYCIRYYRELRNPFSGSTEGLDPGDLRAGAEVLRNILEARSPSKQFGGLETQFYSAFESYVNAPRTAIGTLCMAIDRLAGLVEPFAKLIAYHFLPDASVQKTTARGRRSYLLWKTSNYAEVLEALGLVPVADLYKDQDGFWQQKPPALALLREGFAARQKGAHESRLRTLQELEATAYSVIGQYFVICLHLLRDSSVRERVRALTEKARVLYLLRERTRAFPLTGGLLSRREHLLLYRHRKDLEPDHSEKQFLFLNYLGRRGPCFYWIRKHTAEVLEWAQELYSKPPDETVKKNAARYILNHGQPLPLKSLLETFGDYDEKAELAKFLEACATSENKAQLLGLVNDKREEVALVARKLLARIPFGVDARLRRLATSRSDTKIRISRIIVHGVAKRRRRDEYRRFPTLRDMALRVIYAYCLGEVGEELDLTLLEGIASKRRLDNRLRMACWYAFTRICSRYARFSDVTSLLRKRDRAVVLAALDAVTREGIGDDLRALQYQFERGGERIAKTSAATLRIAGKHDRMAIRAMIRNVQLGNDSRDLILAMCKVGNVSDCKLILRMIGNAERQVQLYNHVRIAEAVASICGQSLRKQLRRCLSSPEFWNYIGKEEKRPQNRLPIRCIENQALYRRLLGACFINIATARDLQLLKRLAQHNYEWIAKKAGEKLAQYGREEDLAELSETLLASQELEEKWQAPLLEALCRLDYKLYAASA